MIIFLRKLILVTLVVSLCGCSASGANTKARYSGTGKASWYGGKFHGRKTASGAIFNKHGHSAAHRSLPLLSLIKVTNMRNHKQSIVIVNDRGPYSGHRILDVSEKVASELGFKHIGTATIKIEYLPVETKALLKKAGSSNPRTVCKYFEKTRSKYQRNIRQK